MTVRELYSELSLRIPASLSCDWDHDGLSVCHDGDAVVSGVLITLDADLGAIMEAQRLGFNVILAHHPLIFNGIHGITYDTAIGRRVAQALRSGISVMSFHTRADGVSGGVGTCLAQALELSDIQCHEDITPMLYSGSLPRAMTASELALYIKEHLGSPSVTYADGGRPISRVAALGGAGKSFSADALSLGVDAYITGELSHELLVDAPDMGASLFAAGHYATEYPVCRYFEAQVSDIAPGTPTFVYRHDPALVC